MLTSTTLDRPPFNLPASKIISAFLIIGEDILEIFVQDLSPDKLALVPVIGQSSPCTIAFATGCSASLIPILPVLAVKTLDVFFLHQIRELSLLAKMLL